MCVKTWVEIATNRQDIDIYEIKWEFWRRKPRRLLERGRIAATSMANWGGPATARYLRFVFANESVERLAGIGARVAAVLVG
jgi:hypothetical protein